MSKVILASASPRRQVILKSILRNFSVIPADVEEVNRESAYVTVKENALLKANSVAQKHTESWIIGSDTVVALDDEIIGKPTDLNNAKETLQQLSNQWHEVYTAVALVNHNLGVCENWVETSKVHMKDLSDQLIEQYFELCCPLDKAGSYNIEEHGTLIIDKYDGEFENIMGLPQKSLLNYFKQHNILTP